MAAGMQAQPRRLRDGHRRRDGRLSGRLGDSQDVGCDVELVDINPRRAAIAKRLDLPFATAGAAAPDRTIVVHTSASEAGLQQALRIAATDGTIVEMSWFGDRSIALPLGESFHSRRLTFDRPRSVRSRPPVAPNGTQESGWPSRSIYSGRLRSTR